MADIKSKYRQEAMKHHPDRSSSDGQRFVEGAHRRSMIDRVGHSRRGERTQLPEDHATARVGATRHADADGEDGADPAALTRERHSQQGAAAVEPKKMQCARPRSR